jgi:hypothetical protein
VRWRPYEVRRRGYDGKHCVWRRRLDPAWLSDPAPPELASPWVCIAVVDTFADALALIPKKEAVA